MPNKQRQCHFLKQTETLTYFFPPMEIFKNTWKYINLKLSHKSLENWNSNLSLKANFTFTLHIILYLQVEENQLRPWHVQWQLQNLS